MKEKFLSIGKQLLDFVTVYGLWLVTAALSVPVLIAVRGAINVLFIATVTNRWALRAVDRFSLVLLGGVWLGIIIVLESYFSEGLRKKKLYKRFATVVLSEGAVYGVMTLIQQLSPQLLAS